MEEKHKTSMPDVYWWIRSDYRFDYVGGKWKFARTFLSTSWYEGIDTPTEEEINELIYKSPKESFGNLYSSGVGKLPVFYLEDDPKWEWHTYNSVSFNVYYEVTHRSGYKGLIHETRYSRIRLYRDDGTGKYDNTIKEVLDTDWLTPRLTARSNKVIERTELKPGDVVLSYVEQLEHGKTLEQKTAEVERIYRFKVGDKVTVNWNGKGEQFIQGVIDKTPDFGKDKYYVKMEGYNPAWVYYDYIEERTSFGISTKKKTPASSQVEGETTREEKNENRKKKTKNFLKSIIK